MAKLAKQPSPLYRVTVHLKKPIVRSGLSAYAAKRYIEMMQEKHPKSRITKQEQAL
jgi:hypothetical protein